jgi:hypothetical protein
MNYGELQQVLRDNTHRDDLDPQWFRIVDRAKQRINTRFGLQLGVLQIDTDTNTVLTNQDDLYFYASMREASIYIKDFEEAVRFDELFDKEASRMNIHYRGDDWVTDATELTYVRSEEESAVILESA